MGWIARFFLLVLFLSISELYLLIYVTEHTSLLTTLLLCVLTGVVGGGMVRAQGLRTLVGIQQSLGRGQVPAQEIVSGLILLMIGTFFLTPGFITDALAFLMLVPPVRKVTSGFLIRYFKNRVRFKKVDLGAKRSSSRPSGQGRVIEVEAEVVDVKES